MLTITVTEHPDIDRAVLRTLDWHVGEPIPKLEAPMIHAIRADGKELEWLIWNFRNLPVHLGCQRAIWTGEMATFIFNNLSA